MGLIGYIYKPSYGPCSNGGLSERHDQVTIVNAEGPFEPTPKRPAVMLVPGNLPGTVKLVPALQAADGEYAPIPSNTTHYAGPMMGGCYVDTSDSRFGEAISKIIGGLGAAHGPVPLHDRTETWDQYRALSI